MGIYRKCKEGKTRANLAFRSHALEQQSNPTDARYVGEQENVEHDAQSDLIFRHGVNSRAPESPGMYLCDCGRVDIAGNYK